MSTLQRRIYRKRLQGLLGCAPDEPFFIMCWATFALQSGRVESARDLLAFPPEAAVQDLTSPYAVHPWKIETLLNEILTTPKVRLGPGRVLDCRQFSAIGNLYNVLTKLENAEDGITLKRVSALREMHRLTQRQFEWQRGVWSYPHLYRAGFMYGGSLTRAFFEQIRGFTLDDFSLACFLLRAIYLRRPSITINEGVVGLSKDTLRLIVNLISTPHRIAREQAQQIRAGAGHTAYKPSLFRKYPCVSFGDGRTIAPLPDLVTLRGTTGIFYDVISSPDNVRNEISGRFETYCREFLEATLPGLGITGSYKYQARKGQNHESPDVLLYENGELSVIFECKATRMSYQARFSEDPIADEQRGYMEIARGVFQIWRFASHVRRGILSKERIRTDVKGVVLTLDTWLSMANAMQSDVFKLARRIAAEKDPEITEDDLIGVTFCPIEDLEQTVSKATPASLLTAVRAATEKRFQGWMLSSVHREVAPHVRENTEYPFANRIGEVLPWWNSLEEKVKAAQR